MAAAENAPTIIKRKKVVSGGGHHGGAWKVAYADFVTAMMAFFLLMWLLNATTEKQRKGLADHFSPTIPINRSSGGGDGALGGDSIMADETLSQSGIGASSNDPRATSPSQAASNRASGEDEAEFLDMETMLMGTGGEALLEDSELRHIVSRITDEGFVVEIFSLEDAPLFEPVSDAPTELLEQILDAVGQVFALASNSIAVAGYSREHAVVLRDDVAWPRSLARAEVGKQAMEAAMDPERVHRVTGHGDRSPAVPNPMALRNDRIELILLRNDIDP
ncbi:MAG: flagellar motor protein MotB [Pseudomonadota bacterium]